MNIYFPPPVKMSGFNYLPNPTHTDDDEDTDGGRRFPRKSGPHDDYGSDIDEEGEVQEEGEGSVD